MTISTAMAWPVPVRRWDTAVGVLRVSLGSVFVIAGVKGVVPTLFGFTGRDDLVQKFTDPVTGFLAPWLVERVTTVGVSVDTMLMVLSVAEIAMGLALMLGVTTRMVALGMAAMYVTFTVAAPVAGEIRLARDLTLMVLSVVLVLVLAGPGRWSLDRRIATGAAPPRILRDADLPAGARDRALLMIRLGLALPMLTSVVFTGGAFDNPFNTTLPLAVVAVLGIVLVAGLLPRAAATLTAVWMAGLVVLNLVASGPFIGLDDGKREIAMLAAALAYLVAGPDRWSLPRPRRIRCREADALLLSYVDGTLAPDQEDALEQHLLDCPECWAHVTSYRQTVALGRDLRPEPMPAELYDRLERLAATPTSDRDTAR